MRRWWWLPPVAVVLGFLAALQFGWMQLNQDAPVEQVAIANNAKRDYQPKPSAARIHTVTATQYAEARAKAESLQHHNGIGMLTIPKINTRLPMLGTMTNETLSVGVARYFQHRNFGEGNNVYAAHNFMGGDVLLNRINQLQNGDLIKATDFKQTYDYQVIYNRVVNEKEVALLRQTKSPRLTLIRCEGGENTPYRRVVVGKLVAVKPATKPKTTATTARQASQWLLQTVATLSTGRVPALLWVVILFTGSWLFIGLMMIKSEK